MAGQLVKETTLSTGPTVRIVQTNPGVQPPVYVIEVASSRDALGVPVWTQPLVISPDDCIAAMQAFGVIP